MAKKGYSNTLFWARHIALALLLVIIAGVLIQMKQANDARPLPEGAPEQKSIAKGLSDFYREFRHSSSQKIEEDGGDFVIELSESEQNLESQLQDMSSDLRPANHRWVGEHKHRSFKAGNTLREAMSDYAQQEGMQLIWDLREDFVIKHHFQMDNTIAGSLAKIASAIDSNFDGEVKAFVCPGQRTLVVTVESTPFLKENCNRITAG
ncbi:hypothetical protein DXV75_01560 [Alteromonas aestuariivivens]|uniref:Toxin co-regulated pilus biosynthesis protein Q C-terminal domain-containing protein n=1 Tax=Alteromonas aestuariivivens TaxID=1938339 RepID=A0A3D8MF89_9ALTE|nr:TcpQ domain-containing protein [Alteromonas aestuariivivens]RDV29174.1 hypothetical protein DXV75_01560 [Alteromonas aestuariivivens]